MLPWLPKKLSKRERFFLQLTALTFLVHVLCLGFYLFWSCPEPLTIKMNMQMLRPGVPVRVVPFVRSTGQLKKLAHGSHAQKENLQAKRKKSQIKKSAAPKKTSVKKVKEVKKKKLVEKKDPVKKKPEPEKKKPVEKKKPIKKEKKTTEKKIEKEPAKPEQVQPVQEKKEELVQEGKTGNEVEEIVIGQQEYEVMQLYQEIHDELSTYWHPPAGFNPKKQAILLVSLGQDGAIVQLQVEQPSGILVYDMAARMAVSKAKFPKNIWGQQLRLHF